MAKVAFLGLGVMGFPMAGHLAAKGHEVTVYNRTPAKAQAWVAESAVLIGDVTLEAGASLWPTAVARGDVCAIVIGPWRICGGGGRVEQGRGERVQWARKRQGQCQSAELESWHRESSLQREWGLR